MYQNNQHDAKIDFIIQYCYPHNPPYIYPTQRGPKHSYILQITKIKLLCVKDNARKYLTFEISMLLCGLKTEEMFLPNFKFLAPMFRVVVFH